MEKISFHKDFINSYIRTLSEFFPSILRNFSFKDLKFDCEFPIKPLGYTRNIIFRNEYTEIVIVVWGAKCKGVPHNHGESNCVFTVLSGSVCNYKVTPGHDLSVHNVYDYRVLLPGNIEKEDNPRNFHFVANILDRPSITINCYSPPIASFNSIKVEHEDA